MTKIFIFLLFILVVNGPVYANLIEYDSNYNISTCEEGEFVFKDLVVPRKYEKFSTENIKLLKKLSLNIKNWNAKFIIIGHADVTNTPETSMRNSSIRASLVKRFFLENGINNDQITVAASGEINPPFKNNLSKKENRTTSFKIIHCPKISFKKKKLVLATASKGGTYYPVGKLLKRMWNDTLSGQGIEVEIIETQGSLHNIELLKNGVADLAMMTSLIAYETFSNKKTKSISDYKEFYALSSLWPNVQHFILPKKIMKTGSVSDLDKSNIKYCLGREKSATAFSTSLIINELNYDGFDSVYCGNYKSVVDDLISGELGGASISAGDPVSAIVDLFDRSDDFYIAEFYPEKLGNLSKLHLLSQEIPGGIYNGQKELLMTVAEPNLLVIDNDVDDRIVSLLMEEFFNNLSYLKWSHEALSNISEGNFLQGIPRNVPLHPIVKSAYSKKE